MTYKGKMAWLPSDVMTRLYAERPATMPVADALREILGLEIPEPEPVVEKASDPFPVLHLDVGEEIFFEGAQSKIDAMSKSIKKQSKGKGRLFNVRVTNEGCQVIRTK